MTQTRLYPATLLALLLTACGGGGGGGGNAASSAPPPAVGPTDPVAGTLSAVPGSVFLTQKGIAFTVSGFSNASGSFTARFGDSNCYSVYASSATTLKATCDAPSTAGTSSATLQVFYLGAPLGSGIAVPVVDPATQPAPTFTAPTIESGATWGSNTASLTVTGGQNLFGRSFTASVAGMPCSGATVSGSDLTRLRLTCPTPPGNASSPAVKVVVRYNGSDLTGGGIDFAFAACSPLATPTEGVVAPQLCNADAGSLAASGDSTRGAWYDGFDNLMLVSPSGSYLAKLLIGFTGGNIAFTADSWTTSSAEHLFVSTTAYNTSGSFVPFRAITDAVSTNGLDQERYGSENALAANQASLTGLWGKASDAISLNIASNGSYTGTTSGTNFGTCTLTGNVTHVNPATQYNLYTVTMVAKGASCKLLINTNLTGLANIGVYNVSPSGPAVLGYGLQLLVRAPGQMYIAAGALKQ